MGVAMALGAEPARLMERALATSGGSGSIRDVKHIVILMQENRSFDHYFGTMPGVRGFLDTVEYQSYRGGPKSSFEDLAVRQQTMRGTSMGNKTVSYELASGEDWLGPFELISNPPTVAGQTTNDITHDWGPQHGMWNNGQMDRFGIEHLAIDPAAKWQLSSNNGIPVPGSSMIPTGLTTMGYYRERDSLDFYRAVAETFTICDNYHCSVIGPTDPNRLMWMSGSLGAHPEDKGGQILTTYVNGRNQLFGTLDWPTMPELLTEHGVTWKAYQDPTSNALFNVLTYFKNFVKPQTAQQVENARLGLTPVYPAEFAADVAAGTLPSVSWIMPIASCCEHPATPPEYGEYLVSQILQILTSNPEVWQQTVFLVVYDENGGFFDHVAPVTPGPTVTRLADVPAGSEYYGEYVTTANPSNAAGGPPSDWYGILGPVGLGFRVPCLVLSPFSTGGNVISYGQGAPPSSTFTPFDHTSTFKLIESVFLQPGAVMEGLHVSPWRYGTVGDLSNALPGLKTPNSAVPPLPATSLLFPDVAEESLLNSLAGTVDDGQAYPPPPANNTDYTKLD
jgi:phospholipase C